MPDSDDVVLVEGDGSLRAAGPTAAERLGRHAGKFKLVLSAPNVLICRRQRRGSEHAPILMAGEIVSVSTIMEIVNVITSSNWRGELGVYTDSATRLLGFDQGALKSANSSHVEERLGEVMYRLGAIERNQLTELSEQVTESHRFGQLCVEQGLLNDEKLFEYLHKQAQYIFFGALVASSGSYVFRLPAESEEAHQGITVHLPVQALLMEGVQRVDEMALFRTRIPHGRMCPELRSTKAAKKMDANMEAVLVYCDGARSIDDIARDSGLGEFSTMKAVFHLMQQGQVILHQGHSLDREAAERLLSAFNAIMPDICMAVATYGGLDKLLSTIRAWVDRGVYAKYLGGGIGEDGAIDVEHVLGALSEVQDESPLESLFQALHEFVAFSLFAATNSLPRDQGLLLARDVNRRLKAIRL